MTKLPDSYLMDMDVVEIRASVYHLGSDSWNSIMNVFTDQGGVYHVGIEILGVEWSYGYCEDGCGIFAVEPGHCTLGPFKESVYLGKSNLDVDKLIKVLHRMSLDWNGPDYNITNKNCVVFSTNLLNTISSNAKLPSYTTSLTNLGLSLYGISKTKSISLEKLKPRDIFGASKLRREMWIAAESIMRNQFYDGNVPPSISHIKCPPIAAARHSLGKFWSSTTNVDHTEYMCRSRHYNVTKRNVIGYQKSAATRHLLASLSR